MDLYWSAKQMYWWLRLRGLLLEYLISQSMCFVLFVVTVCGFLSTFFFWFSFTRSLILLLSLSIVYQRNMFVWFCVVDAFKAWNVSVPNNNQRNCRKSKETFAAEKQKPKRNKQKQDRSQSYHVVYKCILRFVRFVMLRLSNRNNRIGRSVGWSALII